MERGDGMIYCNNRCKHQVEGVCYLEAVQPSFGNSTRQDQESDCVYYEPDAASDKLSGTKKKQGE